MANFNIAFQKMLSHEGTYSKDPNDNGGETYKGISRNAHKLWQGWTIIDQYKSKPAFPSTLDKDIELQKQIELFYLYEFWLPLKADQISNQSIANSIFDFGVHASVKTSVRLAQPIVGAKADGILGVITLNKINTTDFEYFQLAFTIAKIKYYLTNIRKCPRNKKYLLGWIARALSFND